MVSIAEAMPLMASDGVVACRFARRRFATRNLGRCLGDLARNARPTSWATTAAKPLPASPARAASMVALSASRLVCEVIELISSITLPMRSAVDESPVTISLARVLWATPCRISARRRRRGG